MKKTFLGLLLIASLIFTLVPTCAFAQSASYTVNGHEYDLIDNYYYNGPLLTSNNHKYIHYYYSDGFFDGPSDKYSAQLATLACNLSMAAWSTRDDEPWLYVHDIGRKALADIGCSEESIYVNNDLINKPHEHSIGVIIGSKELRYKNGKSTGYTLLPVVVRLANYEREWLSNVTIGTEGEAQGFSEAAGKVLNEFEHYLDEYELRDAFNNGKVKVLITGYSRGAAVMNLVGKRFIDKYGAKSLYAYCLEPPLAGIESEKLEGKDYSSIFNLVNYGDLITLVAPSDFGFIRYGTDIVFPSTDLAEYKKEYEAMKYQLYCIDPEAKYDDHFSLEKLEFSNFKLKPTEIEQKDTTPNKLLGDWSRTFMAQITDWSLPTRDYYENHQFRVGRITYPSAEAALRNIFDVFFTLSAEDRNALLDAVLVSDTVDFATVARILTKLENKYWPEIQKDVVTLAIVFIRLINDDIKTSPSEYEMDFGLAGIDDNAVIIGTFIENAKAMLINHDPDLDLAWYRSYDELYDNEEPVSLTIDTVPKAPKLIIGDENITSTQAKTSTKVKSAELYLDSENTKGEIIIYTIEDLIFGNGPSEPTLYQKSITLPNKKSNYKITAYSRYETLDSEQVTYYINNF